MKAHSKFAPSSAHRWMKCPASIAFAISGDESGAAKEGTDAHFYAERSLNGETLGVGEPLVYGSVTDRIVADIDPYVSFVKTELSPCLVEVRTRYDDLIPDGFGTIDVLSFAGGGLTVCDLKYGFIPVGPSAPQLALYLLSAFRSLVEIVGGFSFLRTIVYQPRAGGIKKRNWTIQSLEKFENQVCVAYEKYLEDSALAVTGKHCRFCSGKGVCDQFGRWVLEAFSQDDDAELETQLAVLPSLKQYISEVDAKASARANELNPPQGYKVVQGTGKRVWADIERARRVLGDAFYKEPEPQSPYGVEKFLGKKLAALMFDIGELVRFKTGPLQLATVDDPRKEFNPLGE